MLKRKRRELNLTQSKLAKKLGISKSYLSKLEKHPSTCNPNINFILKLSKELNLDPTEIFLYFIENKDHLIK
ncbi:MULTISPECIES: helix-turn-helix domain-containing protein [Clostridium]|uniref:Transcriptional regulator n=2 Tax=Clostridium TaxID=1485 RepID=A0A1S8RZX4_CLOBE|nr:MULTISPECIES: helix-turn-helix transcriptional regulator [Clostridium]MBA8933347.1 transcriptional regulator with XRE-family HTH domain [Clostridium beijerinckii]MBC2458500.1 helix-turn-helix transcriptional regulator [Clostridium beijerinckii]MBC2475922.1 helix-turn-helix transcriptional regulator [Clostridium beijerinckii]MBN7576067.1 helix-turn-helix transcriptional regulator [Clostridium beijerinckii]MBN7581366.1 helix-turn-helix transcriptional regulator [Clostridium beijerinckii]